MEHQEMNWNGFCPECQDNELILTARGGCIEQATCSACRYTWKVTGNPRVRILVRAKPVKAATAR